MLRTLPGSENPYEPPNTASFPRNSSHAQNDSRRLRPLWIWLGVAVAVSFLGTPADPITMLIALAFGLTCFIIGCAASSVSHLFLRALLIIGALLVGIKLVELWKDWPVASVYAFASMGFGYWACRSIESGKLRIITAFCGGYVFGSILGMVGTVGGAVAGAILADCSLRKPEIDE